MNEYITNDDHDYSNSDNERVASNIIDDKEERGNSKTTMNNQTDNPKRGWQFPSSIPNSTKLSLAIDNSLNSGNYGDEISNNFIRVPNYDPNTEHNPNPSPNPNPDSDPNSNPTSNLNNTNIKNVRGWQFPSPIFATTVNTTTNNSNNNTITTTTNNNNNSDNDILEDERELGKNSHESIYSDTSIPLSLFPNERLILLNSSLLYEESNNNNNTDTSNDTKNSTTKTNEKGAKASRLQAKGSWENPLKDKQGRLIDQPVTFQNRIVSSGYKQQTVRKNTEVTIIIHDRLRSLSLSLSLSLLFCEEEH
jgi:hypothetical protein